MRYDLSVSADETLKEALRRKVPTTEKEEARLFLWYAVCSALFSAIGVLGLFSGFFFHNAPIGYRLAKGEPIFGGSLFGVITEVFRGSIAPPKPAEGLTGTLPLFLYGGIYALALSVLASLAFTVLGFVRGKWARKLMNVNALMLLMVYGYLAILSLLLEAGTQTVFSILLVDPSAAFVLLLFSLALFVLALAERKLRGGLDFLLFLFTACAVLAFAFPGTPLEESLNGIASAPPAIAVPMGIYLAVLVCNLILSAVRLRTKNSYLFDAVRFSLLFASSLALFVGFLVNGMSFVGFFSQQPLPTFFLILPGIAGLLFAAFGSSFAPKRKKNSP